MRRAIAAIAAVACCVLASCAALSDDARPPASDSVDPGTCAGDELSSRCDAAHGWWCCPANQSCGQESPTPGMGECLVDNTMIPPGSFGAKGGDAGAERRVDHLAPMHRR